MANRLCVPRRAVTGAVVAAMAVLLAIPSTARAQSSAPSVRLARSSVVVFEVRHTVRMLNAEQYGGAPDGFQLRAASRERYAAMYFPAAKAGWVQIQDPAAPNNPPLVAPIGGVNQGGFTFQPHHRYSVIVAMARPGRLVFPDADYQVVEVRRRQVINVSLAIQPLPVPGGSSSAVAGFAPADLARDQASMVALSVDYAHASARVTAGDACPAPSPVYPCSLDTAGSFRSAWWTNGSSGQDTVGRAFSSAAPGSYVTGDFEVLDGAPFQSARLIAFGLRVDQ